MIVPPGGAGSQRAWRAAEWALLGLVAAAGFASVLPALAPAWWLADLCSHFHFQWAAVGGFALCVFALRHRWIGVAVAAAAIGVNVVAIAPVVAAQDVHRHSTSAPAGSTLRVVFSNVYYRNTHADRVIAFVTASRADIAVLAEITPGWKAALAPLDREFPYQHYAYLPGQRRTGLLLLSRWPLEGAATLEFGKTGDPGIIATVQTSSGKVHLIGVHPTWPLWRISTFNRNAQFRRIAALARVQGSSTVVVGDFNATEFSPAFRNFVAASGLTRAAEGRGWLPTWPTFFPPLYIQIDHALVSRDLQIVAFSRGSRVGSDHFPIILDLAREPAAGSRSAGSAE